MMDRQSKKTSPPRRRFRPGRIAARAGLNPLRGLACLLLAGILLAVLARVHGGDQGNDPKTFMRAKLVHAQKVLEGLTIEDYDMIAQHAQAMTLLSQDAAWQVLQTAEYTQQSNAFRRSTRALTEAAQNRNLDGATLAYVEVTLKCVECHKYVRGQQP